MATIEFEIDDNTAERIGDSPEARDATAREAVVLHLFSQSEITPDRAAALLGMSVPDLMLRARSLGIPAGDEAEMAWQAEVRRRRSR